MRRGAAPAAAAYLADLGARMRDETRHAVAVALDHAPLQRGTRQSSFARHHVALASTAGVHCEWMPASPPETLPLVPDPDPPCDDLNAAVSRG